MPAEAVTDNEKDATDQPQAQLREYLTFQLEREEYAVPINEVKEIRAWEPVTRIPNSQPWECGLVNIRGAIVPIMDMRKRLDLPAVPFNRHTVVILFTLENAAGKSRTAGAVVDALSDVLRFADHDVQPPPQLKRRRSLRFARGVIEHDQHMVVVLDVHAALFQEA